jgi:oligopeptidase B
MQAPVAIQKPVKLEHHGDVRIDPFFWLRDDTRLDRQVLKYLSEENAYTAAVLADTEALQDDLFHELKGRIKEEDESVAVRRNGWYYYSRTLDGKQYPVWCRRQVPQDAHAETESEQMDERQDPPTLPRSPCMYKCLQPWLVDSLDMLRIARFMVCLS